MVIVEQLPPEFQIKLVVKAFDPFFDKLHLLLNIKQIVKPDFLHRNTPFFKIKTDFNHITFQQVLQRHFHLTFHQYSSPYLFKSPKRRQLYKGKKFFQKWNFTSAFCIAIIKLYHPIFDAGRPMPRPHDSIERMRELRFRLVYR